MGPEDVPDDVADFREVRVALRQERAEPPRCQRGGGAGPELGLEGFPRRDRDTLQRPRASRPTTTRASPNSAGHWVSRRPRTARTHPTAGGRSTSATRASGPSAPPASSSRYHRSVAPRFGTERGAARDVPAGYQHRRRLDRGASARICRPVAGRQDRVHPELRQRTPEQLHPRGQRTEHPPTPRRRRTRQQRRGEGSARELPPRAIESSDDSSAQQRRGSCSRRIAASPRLVRCRALSRSRRTWPATRGEPPPARPWASTDARRSTAFASSAAAFRPHRRYVEQRLFRVRGDDRDFSFHRAGSAAASFPCRDAPNPGEAR